MILASLALAAAVQPPGPPETRVPAKLSLQQQFDLATNQALEGKCTEAVGIFRTLEGRVNSERQPAVAGAIKSRMGKCLYLLSDPDAAQSTLEKALTLLPANDPNFRNDRLEAEATLGLIAYDALRHADATPYFIKALALAETPNQKVQVRLYLARARLFLDPQAAQADADEALRIATETMGTKRETRGEIRTIRGRVLLNRGQAAMALSELRRSVTEQGGMTMRVSISDIVARSDLAIAALQAGDPTSAREYMAYTGAGRFEKAPFASARQANPPPCGGEADLRPDDSAIVQFSVDNDGATRYVQPIWASRPGPMALAFASAVRNWSWLPADAVKIPAFFRIVTRVELRCSNNASRPAATAMIYAAMDAWLASKNMPRILPAESDAIDLPRRVAELARREKTGEKTALIPVLMALADNSVAEPRLRAQWGSRALTLALEERPPVPVEFAMRLRAIGANDVADYRRQVDQLVADPRFAADPVTSGTARLLIADAAPADGSADMTGRLTIVASDSRLPSQHPLRVAALVRLADRQAAKGELEAARTNYTLTGLNDTQCALVGSAPAMRSFAGAFPDDAQRWGFEGWVRFETDVQADGKTVNQRAVTVYPPFVFRDAALKLARTMRFTKTYRPSGDAACSAYQMTVRFQIPK